VEHPTSNRLSLISSHSFLLKWRRNKQSNFTPVSCYREDMLTFDTQSLFRNVPYECVYTTDTTAISWSWKNTLTAIRLPVSKLCVTFFLWFCSQINTLNAELNPICHLLALLGAQHILHVSRIRVNVKGFSLLRFLDHTQLDTDKCLYILDNQLLNVCMSQS
jgi:hypothetical protein